MKSAYLQVSCHVNTRRRIRTRLESSGMSVLDKEYHADIMVNQASGRPLAGQCNHHGYGLIGATRLFIMVGEREEKISTYLWWLAGQSLTHFNIKRHHNARYCCRNTRKIAGEEKAKNAAPAVKYSKGGQVLPAYSSDRPSRYSLSSIYTYFDLFYRLC